MKKQDKAVGLAAALAQEEYTQNMQVRMKFLLKFK